MAEKIILPNELLLARASQAVKDSKVVTIPVKGHSMFPFIHGNEDRVELYPPLKLEVGDVVLAEVAPKHYLLHRIFRFDGKDGILLMGDGNTHTESCLRKDVHAKALVVITKKGKRKRLDSKNMKFLARLWKVCLPIRRPLLQVLWKIIY